MATPRQPGRRRSAARQAVTTRLRKRPAGGILAGFAIAVTLILAAVWTQANVLFWALGLSIGGLIVSVAFSGLAGRALKHLQVAGPKDRDAAVGEPLLLEFDCVSRHRWPVLGVAASVQLTLDTNDASTARSELGAELVPGVPPDRRRVDALTGWSWVPLIKARASTSVVFRVTPSRRGRHRVARLTLSTRFPLNLMHQRLELLALPGGSDFTGAWPSITVLPRVHSLPRALLREVLSNRGDADLRRGRLGSHGDFYGMRPYRVGDAMRHIDWKRSARTGALVTREMLSGGTARLWVELDLRELGAGPATPGGRVGPAVRDALTERAIELAASAAVSGVAAGLEVGLRTRGVDPTHALHVLPMRSAGHRRRLLAALAGLPRAGLLAAAGAADRSTTASADAGAPQTAQSRLRIRPGMPEYLAAVGELSGAGLTAEGADHADGLDDPDPLSGLQRIDALDRRPGERGRPGGAGSHELLGLDLPRLLGGGVATQVHAPRSVAARGAA